VDHHGKGTGASGDTNWQELLPRSQDRGAQSTALQAAVQAEDRVPEDPDRMVVRTVRRAAGSVAVAARLVVTGQIRV
jgi:type IV secretory pathway ATPase VirB11/archaellum biosynthesis ATPase